MIGGEAYTIEDLDIEMTNLEQCKRDVAKFLCADSLSYALRVGPSGRKHWFQILETNRRIDVALGVLALGCSQGCSPWRSQERRYRGIARFVAGGG